MSKYKYEIKATYSGKGQSVKTNLWLISFKEEKVNIIYSPALDLTGSGYTEKQAMNSFSIALEEFIRYTLNKKTVLKELKRLGWIIKGNKKQRKYLSPDLATMISENKDLEDLLANKEFRKIDRELTIPAF